MGNLNCASSKEGSLHYVNSNEGNLYDTPYYQPVQGKIKNGKRDLDIPLSLPSSFSWHRPSDKLMPATHKYNGTSKGSTLSSDSAVMSDFQRSGSNIDEASKGSTLSSDSAVMSDIQHSGSSIYEDKEMNDAVDYEESNMSPSIQRTMQRTAYLPPSQPPPPPTPVVKSTNCLPLQHQSLFAQQQEQSIFLSTPHKPFQQLLSEQNVYVESSLQQTQQSQRSPLATSSLKQSEEQVGTTQMAETESSKMSSQFVLSQTFSTSSLEARENRWIGIREDPWFTDHNIRQRSGVEETMKIANEIQKLNLDGADPGTIKNIKMIINENAEGYFKKHSNLTAISACPLISMWQKQRFEKTWCIVFYCKGKGHIPEGEPVFPEKIKGYPVDIRDGWFNECSKTNDELGESDRFLSKLSSGAQIKIQNGRIGTLGCFVKLSNNSVGCLTCAHVCMPEGCDAADYNIDLERAANAPKVFQPDCQEELQSRHIGHVDQISFSHGKRFKVSIDAALIVLTNKNRLPTSGYFVKANEEDLAIAGFRSRRPPKFCSGEIKEPTLCRVVHKYGCQSGLTTGILVFDGMVVRRENIHMRLEQNDMKRIEMYNQLEIYPLQNHDFFRAGDSGCLVFQLDCLSSRLVAIGLGIGVTSYGAGIATPIRAVLERFNLQPSLLNFPTVEPYEVTELLPDDAVDCACYIQPDLSPSEEYADTGYASSSNNYESYNGGTNQEYMPSSGYMLQSIRYDTPRRNVNQVPDSVQNNAVVRKEDQTLNVQTSNSESLVNYHHQHEVGVLDPKGKISTVNVFRPNGNEGRKEMSTFHIANVDFRLPSKSKVVVKTKEGAEIVIH